MSAAVAIALRKCLGCGDEFAPRRRDQEHCSSGCRVRKHRAQKTRLALVPIAIEADPFAELRDLVREAVGELRAAGRINGDDALELSLEGDWIIIREAAELLRIGEVTWADLPAVVRNVFVLAAAESNPVAA